MPYIDPNRAARLRENGRKSLDEIEPNLSIGDVAWAISEDISGYCKQQGMSFAVLNSLVGALENVKAELRERLLEDYERTKRDAGGDDPFAELILKLP